MFPILQIGPLAIQLPGLILLAGLWAGLTLAERRAERHGIRPDAIYNLVFAMLFAGILGARLSYAGQHPAAFLDNPASLFSLNPGLLDPFGGWIAGGLIGIVYGQRKSLPLRHTLDALTPLLAVLVLVLALSRLASGSGYGAPADVPWAVEIWGARRHPSQAYEAIAALTILAYILSSAARAARFQPGEMFLRFVILTAAARITLETFRGDSHALTNGLRIAQLAAWVLLAACLWILPRFQTGDSDAG